MSKKITAIKKGYGADSIYYTVGLLQVTKIVEGLKVVEYVNGAASKEVIVYNVFVGEESICELEANCGICLYY